MDVSKTHRSAMTRRPSLHHLLVSTGALLMAAAPACNPDCSETRTCPGDRAPDPSSLQGEGGDNEDGSGGSGASTGGRESSAQGGRATAGTGGVDPRSVGARNAGGSAGDNVDDVGGEAGGSPVSSEASCDDDGARRCDGAASEAVLVCSAGTWTAESCERGTLCDSGHGACAPIAPGCDRLAPGDAYCENDNRKVCGPDLVTLETEPCEGRCVAGECVSPQCGDGVVQSGEDCDDGNDIETDTCPTTCKAARCGDGFLLSGSELCDDGNSDDTDECPSTCRAARCGDGFTWKGDEECDDANLANSDDCLDTCKLASCGDGIVNGDEECDDGNDVDTDDCLTACEGARCGDGHVWEGEEECDDGDQDNGDGCSSTCEAEPVQLALGDHHTCALLGDGRLKCWGDNRLGQLGHGTDVIVGDTLAELGPNLPAVLDNVTAVAAGRTHTCAIDNKVVKCWGGNEWGQLGAEATLASSLAPITLPFDSEPRQLCAGYDSTAVLLSDDTARIWGSANNLEPGAFGFVEFSDKPEIFSCGGSSVCALLRNGSVECHGGDRGTYHLVGAPVLNLEAHISPLTTIATGYSQSCVLNAERRARCWGYTAYGQTGDGGQDVFLGDQEAILPFVPLDDVSYLSSGRDAACAIYGNGKTKCWGRISGPAAGQPGLDSAWYLHVDELAPINVGTGLAPISVETSLSHTCAILNTGRVKCWGWNTYGELGIGSTEEVIGDEQGELGNALAEALID